MSKIALIFSKTRSDTVGNYIEKVFQNLHITYDHYCSSKMNEIPQAYDLYFRIYDGYCEREIPYFLKPKIYWVGDVHLSAPLYHMRKQVKDYEIIFSFLHLGAEKLKRYSRKIHVLNYACDPLIHRKLQVSRKFDLGFVGTDGGVPRKFILQELRERYPHSFLGLAPYTKMAEIYSQSKIGFNYTIRGEGMTMRSFEIPACGTILFMQKIKKEWLEDLGFEDRKNLVIYENLEHLIELIDYYLVHDNEREKIAQSGHELVHSRHTYSHKVKEAISLIQEKLCILKDIKV